MSFVKKVQSKVFQQIVLTASQWTSGSSVSSFETTGKITAEEFEQAGDFLVENFPAWSWNGGLPEKRVRHLPAGKQMLIIRNVPCLPLRDDNIEERLIETEGDDEDSGWVQTGLEKSDDDLADDAEAMTLESSSEGPAAETAASAGDDDEGDDDDDEDVPELDEFDYSDAVVEDQADSAAIDAKTSAEASGHGDAEMKTRSYDMSITYDTVYSTPRVWLFGYDADRNPLQADKWREDFSKEHVDRTVTHEQHPHMGYSCPSIHPCKHAEAMQKMISLVVGASGAHIDVKAYLLIFLKFIQAIIPNIEYDYTSNFQIKQS